MTLAPILSPHGVLSLKPSHETMAALDSERAGRLEQAFARGAGHGLLHLGANEVGAALPPVLSWWRELGTRYVTACAHCPGSATHAESQASLLHRTTSSIVLRPVCRR